MGWTCGEMDEYLMVRRVFIVKVSGGQAQGRLSLA